MLGLRTIIYKVEDLQKAKEWYTKAFNIKPYFDEPFYVGFEIKGYELGLLPNDKPAVSKSENVLTYWGVNNIEEEYKRFIALGAIGYESPHNVGGEIVVAAVKDPWGNVIGLIFNPEFRIKE